MCEAIIRHQDLGTVGTITFLGQLIQLATIYDNVGGVPEIVHTDTRRGSSRRSRVTAGASASPTRFAMRTDASPGLTPRILVPKHSPTRCWAILLPICREAEQMSRA